MSSPSTHAAAAGAAAVVSDHAGTEDAASAFSAADPSSSAAVANQAAAAGHDGNDVNDDGGPDRDDSMTAARSVKAGEGKDAAREGSDKGKKRGLAGLVEKTKKWSSRKLVGEERERKEKSVRRRTTSKLAENSVDFKSLSNVLHDLVSDINHRHSVLLDADVQERDLEEALREASASREQEEEDMELLAEAGDKKVASAGDGELAQAVDDEVQGDAKVSMAHRLSEVSQAGTILLSDEDNLKDQEELEEEEEEEEDQGEGTIRVGSGWKSASTSSGYSMTDVIRASEEGIDLREGSPHHKRKVENELDRKRTLSFASLKAAQTLRRFEDELDEIQRFLYGHEMAVEPLMLVATPKLENLQEQLPVLQKEIEELRAVGIDNVLVSELLSGKEGVRKTRDELAERAALYVERSGEVLRMVSGILEQRREWKERGLVKMLVATWNVGNAAPLKDELDEWIPMGGGNNDLIVIGLQECEYELTPEMKDMVHAEKLAKKLTKREWSKMGATSHARANTGVLAENHTTNRLGAYTVYYRLKLENGLKKTITSKVGLHVMNLIMTHIGPDYLPVRESELGQMRMFVFARRAHLHGISDVQYASEATGIGGIAANKGAVAVTMRLHGLRLGWISCHLAAHRKTRFLKTRNENLREIFRLLDKKLSSRGYNLTSELDHLFVLGDLNYRVSLGQMSQGESLQSAISKVAARPAADQESNQAAKPPADLESPRRTTKSRFTLHRFATDAEDSEDDDSDTAEPTGGQAEVLQREQQQENGAQVNREDDALVEDPEAVEMGLSPQIRVGRDKHCDASMDEWNVVTQLIFDKAWPVLWNADQLRKEMKERRVLTSFQEGSYTFPPTFKVLRNKTMPIYVPQRCPSYCDRILWHSVPGRRPKLKQISLKGCHTATSSDHKPVTSEFVLELKESMALMYRESFMPRGRHLDDRSGNSNSSSGGAGGSSFTSVGSAAGALYRKKKSSSEVPLQAIDEGQSVPGARAKDKAADNTAEARTAAGSVDKGKGLTQGGTLSSPRALLRAEHSHFRYEPVGQGGMKIRITKLRVKDIRSIDLDGQADPYITICSPNLFHTRHAGYNPRKGAITTPVLKHRLTAEWRDRDVPIIQLPSAFSTPASVRQGHLVVAVWDHGHVPRDNNLGQANLGLAPVVDLFERARAEHPRLPDAERASAPKEFALPILLHGHQHGVVRGVIQLVGPDWKPPGRLSSKMRPLNLSHPSPHSASPNVDGQDQVRTQTCCCIIS